MIRYGTGRIWYQSCGKKWCARGEIDLSCFRENCQIDLLGNLVSLVMVSVTRSARYGLLAMDNVMDSAIRLLVKALGVENAWFITNPLG